MWGALLGRYVRQNQPNQHCRAEDCLAIDMYAMICHKSSLIRQSYHRKRLRFCVAAAGRHFEHSV